jgi:hypothetical protein
MAIRLRDAASCAEDSHRLIESRKSAPAKPAAKTAARTTGDRELPARSGDLECSLVTPPGRFFE